VGSDTPAPAASGAKQGGFEKYFLKI
jgi:hypothetical protein